MTLTTDLMKKMSRQIILEELQEKDMVCGIYPLTLIEYYSALIKAEPLIHPSEENKRGKRILQIAARLSSGQRGLRHRHRQRMAVPVCGRRERRGSVRAAVSGDAYGAGTAGAYDGACGRTRQPQERRPRL